MYVYYNMSIILYINYKYILIENNTNFCIHYNLYLRNLIKYLLVYSKIVYLLKLLLNKSPTSHTYNIVLFFTYILCYFIFSINDLLWHKP